LTVFPIVLAQDTVGVKAGDWVKYKVTRLGSSFAWIYEKVVWIKVEVLNVSGTTVAIREIEHYDDGSEWIRDFSSNLLSSPTYVCYIIAANLGPGDKIGETHIWFKNWTGYVNVDLTLNDTVPRSYGGMTREVNQLSWSQLRGYFWDIANYTHEVSWDKDTGFLLNKTIQGYLIDHEEYPSTFKMEVVDTNMWEMEKPPQQSFLWLAAIPIGTVIVAAVAVKLRNDKKKNEDDKQ
jgi:hypothetical protein